MSLVLSKLSNLGNYKRNHTNVVIVTGSCDTHILWHSDTRIKEGRYPIKCNTLIDEELRYGAVCITCIVNACEDLNNALRV